jgi:branched-chain amino acid transport system substrate-binding protein
MLPFSGTFAALGENIAAAFELHLQERGGRMGGRPVQVIRLDDESNPANAVQNVNRLVGRDRAEALVGTVHSGRGDGPGAGVAGARRAAGDPNAGNVAATRELCAPTVFRASFSNWQPAYGMGLALGKQGVKRAAWITWDYAAGNEAGEGFRDGLRAGGRRGGARTQAALPGNQLPALLAQVPGLNVEAVGSFFAGGGAVQFVREYAAAGLKDRVPLCGSGFLTEGTLAAQGAAAEGVRTALHYGDGLDNPKNRASAPPSRRGRRARPTSTRCRATTRRSCSASGLDAVRGDLGASASWSGPCAARASTAPRGAFTLSPSHNPCRTCTCARRAAGRTWWSASAPRRWPAPAPACQD